MHTSVHTTTLEETSGSQITMAQVRVISLRAIRVQLSMHSLAPPINLSQYVVGDAGHDSNVPRRGCMKGTREDVFARIFAWFKDPTGPPICWFRGTAGAGKSAIAKTVADRAASSGLLAASFFFSRGGGRRSHIQYFISTLAYQLSISVPATRSSIEAVFRTDPTIVDQSFQKQLTELIMRPMMAIARPIPRMLIVVDALDECIDRPALAAFLETILWLSCNQQLPFRFLFTSRIEEHIHQKFELAASTTHILDLQNFDARSDIKSFLTSRFSTLCIENPWIMRGIQQPWPSDSEIQSFVDKSEGSFIFASTLFDYITDGRGPPQRKLETALTLSNGLDPLYRQVFDDAPRHDPFNDVIGGLFVLKQPLSIIDFSMLLRLESFDVVHTLIGIQSILQIPEDNNKPVRFLHASLGDFLGDRRRSSVYWINPPLRNMQIASDCLQLIASSLPGKDFSVSKVERYACYHWMDHMRIALNDADEGDIVSSVLRSPALMSHLTALISDSLVGWGNTLLRARSYLLTLKVLKDVTLKLEVSHQSFPMVQFIQAYFSG